VTRSAAGHPIQLELPFAVLEMTEARWRDELSTLLDQPVSVRFTRARTTPLVVERSSDHVTVRMHEMFRRAPSQVVAATGAWIRAGKRARRAASVLDAWIDAELERLPVASITVVSKGAHFDLASVAGDLIANELAGDFASRERRPRITWGRSNPNARRSLQLGSYDAKLELVTIHPVVDRADVPAFFVRYLVFHELLHAVVPAERSPSGRWLHHPPAFRARERAYPDYGRAVVWQAANLDELLRLPPCKPPRRRR